MRRYRRFGRYGGRAVVSREAEDRTVATTLGQHGHGLFVLVVGPSGAGKDTLIGLARKALGDDPHYLFVRRVVTRPAGAYEDHESLSEADFEAAEHEGRFALTWAAHGLRYGLPATIIAAIEQGQTVVANVSRTIIADVRAHYQNVRVVLVTAPPDVLAARLAARGRAESLATRLERGLQADSDVVIDNIGDPAIGAAALVEALRSVQPDHPPAGSAPD